MTKRTLLFLIFALQSIYSMDPGRACEAFAQEFSNRKVEDAMQHIDLIKIDFSKLDLSALDLSRVRLPNIPVAFTLPPDQFQEIVKSLGDEIKTQIKVIMSGALVGEIRELGGACASFVGEIGNAVNNSAEELGEVVRGSIAGIGNTLVGGTLFSAAGCTLIIGGGIVVTYAGIKYISKYLYEPNLIEKQPSSPLLKKLLTRFYYFMKTNANWCKEWCKKRFGKDEFRKHLPIFDSLTEALNYFTKPMCIRPDNNSIINNIRKHMVISKQQEKVLSYLMAATFNVKKNGGEFDNAAFYGDPGTGKTLFAKLLSEHSGMEYAYVPGANVSQFLAKGTAVEELNNLFDRAARSKKGMIIFFDEAETFLAQRDKLSIEAQNALNAFLARTGTSSSKVMIICATNRPEMLDSAVKSRFGMVIHFPLPDAQARKEQLMMHINKTFQKQQGVKVEYTCLQDSAFIESLAHKLEGCSGRFIQQFVNRLRQAALAQDCLTIDQPFVEQVLEQSMQRFAS